MRDDVAIVGAGPAGARAAYVLATRGARVTIFDASHPREKPCGGGVTGRALALVADAIDAARLPRVGHPLGALHRLAGERRSAVVALERSRRERRQRAARGRPRDVRCGAARRRASAPARVSIDRASPT